MKRFVTLLTATIVTVTLLSASASAQQRYFSRNNGWFSNSYLFNGASWFRFNQNGPVRRTINTTVNTTSNTMSNFANRMPSYRVGNGNLAARTSNATRRNVQAATRASRNVWNESSRFARQTMRTGQNTMATVLGN